MKKQLLYLAAIFLTTGAYAQEVSFGPTAGLNYNIVSESVNPEPDDYEADNASGVGFMVGAFARIGLTNAIAIRPELQYSIRKTQTDYSDSYDILGVTTSVESTSTGTDSYLSIPLLIDYALNENLSLQVGPTASLLLGTETETESTTTVGGVSSTEVSSSNSDEGRNGFELGLTAGAMLNTDLGLGVGFRYTRGLTTLNEETEFGDATYKLNYNVIQLVVSFAIGG